MGSRASAYLDVRVEACRVVSSALHMKALKKPEEQTAAVAASVNVERKQLKCPLRFRGANISALAGALGPLLPVALLARQRWCSKCRWRGNRFRQNLCLPAGSRSRLGKEVTSNVVLCFLVSWPPP